MITKLLTAKKIAIFGWPASGKSTLGNFLSKHLNIKVYSLDLIRWQESKNGIKDASKFIEEYELILKESEWIIEGNALDWIDSRLEQADVLIFFDSTIDKCIKNYTNREQRIKLGKETRLFFDTSKTTSDTIDWIQNRYAKKIENLRPILKNYKDKLLVINNFEELDEIIKTIETSS